MAHEQLSCAMASIFSFDASMPRICSIVVARSVSTIRTASSGPPSMCGISCCTTKKRDHEDLRDKNNATTMARGLGMVRLRDGTYRIVQ